MSQMQDGEPRPSQFLPQLWGEEERRSVLENVAANREIVREYAGGENSLRQWAHG